MSSKPAGPSLIQLPPKFSIVEQGVYRSASPTAAQIPFLAQLQLKTLVSLTPEHPIKPLLSFVQENQVDFIHLGQQTWGPRTDWKPVKDELVKSALELMLDTRNHPLLLIDPLGIHQTGCVVGALRIMQDWNFASILVEYRAHSGPTKHRISDEQAIEMFDVDLINLPPPQYLPRWFQATDAAEEIPPEGSLPTEEREVKSIIAGSGEAQEPLLGLRQDDPLIDTRLNGVG